MKTYSPFASYATSTRADETRSCLRLLVLGAVGGLAAFAALPWMSHHWTRTRDRVEQLCDRANGPFAPLPGETPVRELAGMNAR